jgi:hypothetical protein
MSIFQDFSDKLGGLLVDITTRGPLTGWRHVKTISGADGGLGLLCDKCHLQIMHSAPHRVFHCGRWDSFDDLSFIEKAKLPTVRLGQTSKLDSRFLFVDF